MRFDQVSGDEARAKVVTREAMHEHVGTVSPDRRMQELDGGVEMLAYVLCGFVRDGHVEVLELAREHRLQLLVKCDNVGNVVTSQQVFVLGGADISKVQVVYDLVHLPFSLFETKFSHQKQKIQI